MLFMYTETKCHCAIVHLSIHEPRNIGLKYTADYNREKILNIKSQSSVEGRGNCDRDNPHFLRVDFTNYNILD